MTVAVSSTPVHGVFGFIGVHSPNYFLLPLESVSGSIPGESFLGDLV